VARSYFNQPLFDLTSEETDDCMERLRIQSHVYSGTTNLLKWKMQARALMVCAYTLNATAIWTAKLLMRGTFSMQTQRLFFRKRWRVHPSEWGKTAKSCFARALCGSDIGKDGVCIDRHLERMGSKVTDAEAQWREWFRLYESLYGPGETVLCIRWHEDLLDWIALQGPKPKPWK
jgi:hypothetical protein